MTWNAGIPALTNQISADIPDIEENMDVLGKYNTVWVGAGAMTALVTNGAEAGVNEYATNDVMMDYFAFDGGATPQYVSFTLVMPENWDLSTILAKFYWAPGSSDCTAGDTVEWKIQAISITDDDAIDAAYTDTGEVITDTVLAGKNADLHVTAKTPAVTINGEPAVEHLVNFKIKRNVAGTDDMTEDAWLFGVVIQYAASVGIEDAWS